MQVYCIHMSNKTRPGEEGYSRRGTLSRYILTSSSYSLREMRPAKYSFRTWKYGGALGPRALVSCALTVDVEESDMENGVRGMGQTRWWRKGTSGLRNNTRWS